MHPKVKEFFAQRENLELALDLERALADVKAELFRMYWTRVFETLNSLATGEPEVASHWNVVTTGDLGQEKTEIWIAYEGNLSVAGIVLANLVTHRGNGAFFGIRVQTNSATATASELERQTRDKLAGQRYAFQSGYLGWKHFGDTGLPRYCRNGVQEDVLGVSVDNEAGGPNATQHAETVWGLFMTVREILERYNQSISKPNDG